MSKAGLNEKVDVIVIGAGVAGAVSAAFLANSGLKVAIVDRPAGASLQSSGAVDVADDTPSIGQAIQFESAAHKIAKSRRVHPYAKVGEAGLAMLPEALSVLKKLAADVDFHLGRDGRNMLLATQLGTTKHSAMVQRTQSYDLNALSNGDCVAVLGFSSLPSFDARAVARMLTWSLQRTQNKEVVVQPLFVDSAFESRKWRSCMEMANALDDGQLGDEMVQAIHETVIREDTKHQAVFLPPILGRYHYRRRWHALNEMGDDKFFELLAMPHSVPGLRLKDALMQGLKKHGVHVLSGEVVSTLSRDKVVENIVVENMGERLVLSSRAFVLATGRFLSGGFVREGTRKERVFGLPLWDEGRPIEDAHVLTLSNHSAFKEHSIFSVGISVDEKLRPHDRHMELFALNLFAAGSSIGGYDASGLGSGLGVAALTGLVSGSQVRDYLTA